MKNKDNIIRFRINSKDKEKIEKIADKENLKISQLIMREIYKIIKKDESK